MAIIMDGHAITQLVLNASNGTSVTKQLTESGSVSVDDWDIYDKELIDTWGGTLNLHSDTNFDNLTPSTNATYIQANTETEKSFSVDFTDYRYMILREMYYKVAYKNDPADKAFAKRVNIAVIFLSSSSYKSILPGSTTLHVNGSTKVQIAGMTYQYNANGEIVSVPNGQTYGLYEYEARDVPTFSSTSVAQTTCTVGAPRWTMRGSASYSPVSTLEDIDSANSTIEYRYRLFKIPYETLFWKGWDELLYIFDNNGLRTLPSSGT